MMRLSEAAQAVGGTVLGEDVEFAYVSNDSRKPLPGQLFVAMRGTRVDGHDFALSAIAGGASAVMVERPIEGLKAGLLVKDCRLALGQLAAYWRNQFKIPLAGVTGSNGKTTVKEMLAAILTEASGSSEAVLATEGNLNNDLGLPLTLLRLRTHHQYAVAEMGMNHFGEIRYLTNIGRPTVALVNNATMAHLGGLGSVENIAQAKGEIFEGLQPDGIAVINADDTYAPLWTKLAINHQQLTFGLEHVADVSAHYQLHADHSDLMLKTPLGEAACVLAVAGKHNVYNALAATAVAIGMGLSLEAIAKGLSAFGGVRGRLQHKAGLQGATVIDDTYNANPASMKAAIDVLAARSGSRLLVLGDMGELGDDAPMLHAEIGRYAKTQGIPALFALGELSRETVQAFGEGAQHFDVPEVLANHLIPLLNATTTVLVKGSRFMQMERVVNLIASQNQGEKH